MDGVSIRAWFRGSSNPGFKSMNTRIRVFIKSNRTDLSSVRGGHLLESGEGTYWLATDISSLPTIKLLQPQASKSPL